MATGNSNSQNGRGRTNFLGQLESLADYAHDARIPIKRATVAATEAYVRKVLGIGPHAPISYMGMRLRCIGSKAWRARQAPVK